MGALEKQGGRQVCRSSNVGTRGHAPAALVDVGGALCGRRTRFCQSKEILAIRSLTAGASGVETLVVALEGGAPLGFAGAVAGRLEMLFWRRKRGRRPGAAAPGGGDRALQCRGADGERAKSPGSRLYEHLGFRTKRTELDEEGRPYPLLYMRREATLRE